MAVKVRIHYFQRPKIDDTQSHGCHLGLPYWGLTPSWEWLSVDNLQMLSVLYLPLIILESMVEFLTS